MNTPQSSPQSSEDTADDRLDAFIKTLKIHNKDLVLCFNDAVAERHLRTLVASYLAEQEAAHQHLHEYGMDDYRCVLCGLTVKELHANTERLEAARLKAERKDKTQE